MTDYSGSKFPKRVTRDEFLRELNRIGKRPKFGAKRSDRFDSGVEREVFQMYAMLEKSGEISDLIDHPKLDLVVNGVRFGYTPDGSFTKGGERFWFEVKGEITAKKYEWSLKKRLWRAVGPGKLLVYIGTKGRYGLAEVITPMEQTLESHKETFEHVELKELREKVEQLTQDLASKTIECEKLKAENEYLKLPLNKESVAAMKQLDDTGGLL